MGPYGHFWSLVTTGHFWSLLGTGHYWPLLVTMGHWARRCSETNVPKGWENLNYCTNTALVHNGMTTCKRRPLSADDNDSSKAREISLIRLLVDRPRDIFATILQRVLIYFVDVDAFWSEHVLFECFRARARVRACAEWATASTIRTKINLNNPTIHPSWARTERV